MYPRISNLIFFEENSTLQFELFNTILKIILLEFFQINHQQDSNLTFVFFSDKIPRPKSVVS